MRSKRNRPGDDPILMGEVEADGFDPEATRALHLRGHRDPRHPTPPPADQPAAAEPSLREISAIRLLPLADDSTFEAPDLQPAGERYGVIRLLGEGTMGRVYLVADRALQRRVAMKMLRPGMEAESGRFLQESQILGQLEHPNIVPLYDLAPAAPDGPFVTMRYVRGRTLKDVLDGLRQAPTGDGRASRGFSLTRLIQIFLQITQAVSYAHARGVVHRDLKPGNVMLGAHGEVQVLDWGLAKIADTQAGSIATADAATDDASVPRGEVVGTPAYMAPEQALGRDVDGRADIYALGAILYEILTLERPFVAKTQLKLMTMLLSDPPEPPRRRAPNRTIPLELEATCLRALAKRPEDRQPSAGALADEVQLWLETSADQQRRRERAGAKVDEGRRLLAEYDRRRAEIVRLAAATHQLERGYASWQSVTEKGPLFKLQDELASERDAATRAASRAVVAFDQALGFESDNAAARDALADYYYARFREAEAIRDHDGAQFLAEQVAAYHDGKYASELAGRGTLELTSNPAGAAVWLSDLVVDGLRLVPTAPRLLGVTPLPAVELAMGSYLAEIVRDGDRLRYPVYISRNKRWLDNVSLFAPGSTPVGFVHVPAGPTIIGGDASAWNASREATVITVDDFLIAIHPVTMAEYLEFLNDADRVDDRTPESRAPRHTPTGGCYLGRDADGRLVLPEEDQEGDRWQLDWPVIGISFDDALAYCAWRGHRDGQPYRLPTETEWEKAARGVDGRELPWGDRFDPSLANIRGSRRGRMAPAPVTDFPADESVYGVRGLCGNVRDFTSTEEVDGDGETARVVRILRGGAWDWGEPQAHAATRHQGGRTEVRDNAGFRLALTPSRPTGA